MAVTSIGQFISHHPLQSILHGERPQFVGLAHTQLIRAVACEALAEVATEYLGGMGCSMAGRVPVVGPLVGTLFDSATSLTGIPLGTGAEMSPQAVRWAVVDGWQRCKESLRTAGQQVVHQLTSLAPQSQSWQGKL